MIIIVTIADDLHALTVQHSLREHGYQDCHIIECDRVAQRCAMTYGLNYDTRNHIVTSEGNTISVSDATVLWLRTIATQQLLRREVEDDRARTLISNEARGGLLGYLETHFRGTWVSTIDATYRASDKILQLRAASECGFRVPKTLVSQCRSDIAAFFDACGGQVIVKPIIGVSGPLIRTSMLDEPNRYDDDSLCASPTLYQEYVAGHRHIRLNCFGNASFAAEIVSRDLDWRPNLNVPIAAFPVEPALHHSVRRVLNALGLAMGIVDLKLTPGGDVVWLEVNPQGQFLFLDALTDLGLVDRFAAYLHAEHTAVSERSSGGGDMTVSAPSSGVPLKGAL